MVMVERLKEAPEAQVVGKERGFGGLGGGAQLMAFLKAHRESVFY